MATSTTKKAQSKKPATTKTTSRQRVRKLNHAEAKKEAKRKVAKKPRLVGGFALLRKCVQFCRDNARIITFVSLIYLVLHILLVRGFAGPIDIQELRGNLEEIFENPSQLVTALSIFGFLVTNGASGSDTFLQVILFILVSLVLIWTMRQLFSGKYVTLKQAYYSSTGQLIPFILTAGWIVVQLLPVTIATIFLQFAVYGGIVGGLELAAIVAVFLLLFSWSVYLLCGSLFALYIVTLPDMTPLRALRSAKQLVRFRRLKILRRLIVLPLTLLCLYVLIILPLILYVPILAEPIFYILSIASVTFTHLYVYHLYRELLK